MPFCYSCHVIIWLVLVGSLLGLLYVFPLLNSSGSVISLGQYSCYFGLPWSISSLSGFLGPFHFLGHPQPISFPWVSLAHSNSSFPWVFTSLLGFLNPNYHILYFWDFPPTLYSLNSLLWASLAHTFVLSISLNAHEFTTSFSRLLWAHLLSLRPFCYFLGL